MKTTVVLFLILTFVGCKEKKLTATKDVNMNIYTSFKLTSDLSYLSANQRKMISYMIDVAKIMDALFWKQAYGEKEKLLSKKMNPKLRKFIQINYGPWNRLRANKSFVVGIPDKLPQANFYPFDMTKSEFATIDDRNKKSLYTILQRDKENKIRVKWYHEIYASELKKAASLLLKASEFADDAGLKKYLQLRSRALLSSNYFESDMAWMDMKQNTVDFVVGPIENYEDQLFGYKAAFEAYVLIKDKKWSERLAKYVTLLPVLQKDLPVSEKYKQEKPGSKSDLNAYDVIYYAGDCNAGSKTIAINLPNDEKVQLEKGTRRLQLKNAMKAKFDKILIPIAHELIIEKQQKNISFDAFFSNTMFHEVAHGLGIKNTINDRGTVREALKEKASALEEGKADILGLYMITKLAKMGEFPEEQLMNNYVTFMTSIFRSIRFGAASAHGRANLLRFNYFKEMNAFTRDAKTGRYQVDFEKMKLAMNSLSNLILTLQGNGDYEAVSKLMTEKAVQGEQLTSDLKQLEKANIPVDVIFEQGKAIIGIK